MAVWNEPKSNYVAGDEVTPDIFNGLAENEKYLKEQTDLKITSDQVKDAVITNTIYSTRTNLTASEKLQTGFAKIRKWFSDLKALAFKDTVGNADITDVAASKVTGLSGVATSGSYNDLSNKPNIPSADGTSIKNTNNVLGLNGYSAAALNSVPKKIQTGIEWVLLNGTNGIPVLDANGKLTPSQIGGTLVKAGTSVTVVKNADGSYTVNNTMTQSENANTVTNQRTGTLKFWAGTASSYNAITAKDGNTLYFVY
jgi:hypothetical protein